QVFPDTALVTAADAIVWSFDDPDDPTNEDPHMHRDAGAVLDPGDYAAGVKTSAAAGDNNAYGTGVAVPRVEEADPTFALAGTETKIDPATRTSKVRLHLSDGAGDNFRVTARFKPNATITRSVPFTTGIITMWNRIDLEYCRMASAAEIAVEEL